MPTPPRRWLAFRLRTLLLAVIPLCAVLTWVARSLNWISQRRQALEQHEVLERGFDYRFPAPTAGTQIPLRPSAKYTNECQAPGGLWLFGEVGRKELMSRNASNVQRYQRLFPEAKVTDDRNFYQHFPDTSR